MHIDDVNGEPLAAAMLKIGEAVLAGASGNQEMRDLLWLIRDTAEAGTEAFRENIIAAHHAETVALRKAAGL